MESSPVNQIKMSFLLNLYHLMMWAGIQAKFTSFFFILQCIREQFKVLHLMSPRDVCKSNNVLIYNSL